VHGKPLAHRQWINREGDNFCVVLWSSWCSIDVQGMQMSKALAVTSALLRCQDVANAHAVDIAHPHCISAYNLRCMPGLKGDQRKSECNILQYLQFSRPQLTYGAEDAAVASISSGVVFSNQPRMIGLPPHGPCNYHRLQKLVYPMQESLTGSFHSLTALLTTSIQYVQMLTKVCPDLAELHFETCLSTYLLYSLEHKTTF